MDPQREQQLLDQLRGLELPPEPGIWPPALGWWLVMAFVLTLVGLWLLIRRWRRQTWKKIALREHRQIAAAPRDTASQRASSLARLSVLMRRVALATCGRAGAASATEEDWLAILDTLSGSKEYTHGAGKRLQRHPYMRPDSLSDHAFDELLQLTLRTIHKAERGHRSTQQRRQDRLEASSVRL